MTYPETPELDKLKETMELHEFTQRLGEALDGTEDFVLAAWVPDHCHNCNGNGTIYDTHEGTDWECRRCKGTGTDPKEITLAHRSPSNRNLAILFGLDSTKMEDERDAVLVYVREQAT
jgi:hypothetical protein